MIPIDLPPAQIIPINRMAQQSTKETYPWWWNKYGCEGTQWYGPGPCRDLTNGQPPKHCGDARHQ